MVVGPCLPLQALRPHHLLVAAQQHGIEHALDQRVIALHLPTRRAGGRDQLSAAGEFVEIFDDDVGIDDDIAIIQDQRRQLLQRIDFRVFVVWLTRYDGRRNELDLVDQPKLDRGDANLAGERRGRREGKFHFNFLRNKSGSSVIARSKATKQSSLALALDCFASLAMTWMAPKDRSHKPHAAIISWRCSPRPSMPSVTTSPTLRNFGGFMPVPTPGGVPVVMMSPGSSVMNCET